MIIDDFYAGTTITNYKPRFVFEDGKPTSVQDSENGVPLWNVEVAVKDGVFILPVSIKVAHSTEPKVGTTVQFSGVSVTSYNGRIFYSAQGMRLVDNLESLFEEGGGVDAD